MLVVAMISTVALLVWMGFFMMGSLPLLILKHDSPVDARFVRGFFNLYYIAITLTGMVGAVSFALAARPLLAAGVAFVAACGFIGRRRIVADMDRLRSTMTAQDEARIRQFRRLHIGGMVGNIAMLSTFCVAMTQVRL